MTAPLAALALAASHAKDAGVNKTVGAASKDDHHAPEKMSDAVGWLSLIVFVGVGFLLVIGFFKFLAFAFTPARCDMCQGLLKRKRYSGTVNGKHMQLCPNCARRLEGEASRQAVNKFLGKSARSAPRPPPPPKGLDIPDTIAKLEAAKGPAGRRAVLSKALAQVTTAEQRQHLMLEASKIEVQAVLDKADGLKSATARKRNLQAALDAIKADDVPDELQAEQVKWLEDAIAAVDRETS